MQRLLFDHYAGKMMAICRRYTRDQMEAEDMLQDGFIKIFTKISQVNGGNLEGWMRQVFVHTCLSNWKNNKRLMFVNEDQGFKISMDEENGLQQMETHELLKLIDELPQGAKIIFNLFAVEGFQHKEIAGMLGITEGASRAQLTRARQLLQLKLRNHH